MKDSAVSNDAIEPPAEMLSAWSNISTARSMLKLALYWGSMLLFGYLAWFHEGLVRLVSVPMLGLVFAHGLELQHEALHDNLFQTKWPNRLVGFLVGLPMLVSIAHYKYQHLHHHRYVGTEDDRELFDYDSSAFTSVVAFVVRAWNFSRLPAFFLTLFGILQGGYPAVFKSDEARRQVRFDYVLLGAFFISAVALACATGETRIVWVWFAPWLLFGEPMHFFIELPEHLYCDKQRGAVEHNTRSYKTNFLLSYLMNQNNYHAEHHMYPKVAVHNLGEVHRYLSPRLKHTGSSYRQVMAEIWRASRAQNEVRSS